MEKKVLFLDSVHPVLAERLKKMGFSCEENYSISREELAQVISSYHGLVIRSRIVLDKNLLERAVNLKFIARSGSGMENIDVNYAEKMGVSCINSPEGNRSAVAEHAIGMLLSLFNHLSSADAEVRKNQWNREKNRGIELEGKTIGIIGYGNTGISLAKRLSGFGMTILVYDKYKRKLNEDFVQMVSLDALKKQSDIVSFHLPLNQETKHFLDRSFLDSIAKPIYVVNTSRGPIVETAALIDGLKSGKVAGACLDVLEQEDTTFESVNKIQENEDLKFLFESKKVLLSPHVAGWTVESYYKLSSVLADKIALLPQDQ